MAKEYDAVVVGSGPGGASAARELCRAGKKVILLEKGPDSRRAGNTLAALYHADMSCAIPVGHPTMIRGVAVGGTTLLYCGTSVKPAPFIKEQTGIDLMPYAEEFERELNTGPLPDRLVGDSARRILEGANRIGIDWRLLPKFINPDKCEANCGDCMLGCRTGAKWTSREFVEQAQAMGMDLTARASVEEVIQEHGTAMGVRGKNPWGAFEIRAERVVLAAGGLGTPVILKRSGIDEAGEGFFSDPLVFTYGYRPGQRLGSCFDIPMTGGTWQFHSNEGFMMTDLSEPWLMQLGSQVLHFPPRVDQAPHVLTNMGIMTKVKDPVSGTISREGKLTKNLEPEVRNRLESGDRYAREILLAAGCRKSSLYTSPVRAAHPGGSAPIGKVVDTNLESRIKNCYVCDASVVPDELGTPVVLLALCLGRYAGERMLA
ncbi:MAG: GMC family oxidoreductase, partial [Deltaproteobacteria bacterium]|nr:GMC family oxidoreductase [Deltaproteobacteria bacterium]